MLLQAAEETQSQTVTFDVKSPKKFTRQTGVFAAWV
jgi:hypothetical protein